MTFLLHLNLQQRSTAKADEEISSKFSPKVFVIPWYVPNGQTEVDNMLERC